MTGKAFPKQVRFLLAESIREEAGGKLTLLGLFSGNELIMHDPMPETLSEGAKGIALTSLAVLATFTGGKGEFDVEATVYDPSGNLFLKAKPIRMSMSQGAPMNLIVPFVPFPVRGFGTYKVGVTLDKKHSYDFSFRVAHRDPNAKVPTPRATEPSVVETDSDVRKGSSQGRRSGRKRSSAPRRTSD